MNDPSSSGSWNYETALLQRRNEVRTSRFLSALVILPLLIFSISIWLVRPFSLGDTFSLTLAAPGLLLIGVLLVRLPRGYVLDRLSAVRFEFALLLLMVALSLLSIVNSESPIRSFRIIYPSLLPLTLFAHLLVVGYLAPERLRQIPMVMIAGAVVFSMIPILLATVLPPVKSLIYEEYRARNGFENSIQHSIALTTIVPLVVYEFSRARKLTWKVGWAIFLVAFAYTAFRAGSKSAMGVDFLTGVIFYLLLALQTREFKRILGVVIGIVFLGAFLWMFGLSIAEKLSPLVAEKIRSIIEGGVSNYQSIESRQMLWAEAIRQGKAHWLIGTGAGEKVLGVAHSHNLVLDYFKGIGIFGAAAIALLCLAILLRTGIRALGMLRGNTSETEIRGLACFFGASNYVICSQLSDRFGPSTVGFLWLVFLTGIFLVRSDSDRGGKTQRSISV